MIQDCDISFAHPYPIVGSKTFLTKNQALQSMRNSNLTFQKKNSKYKNISNDNSLEFRPLIFESTGKFHKSTAEFFNKAMHLMSNDSNTRQHSTTCFCWSSRISCCIQKCIADSYLSRSRAINGNITRNLQYAENFMGRSFRLSNG